MSSTKPFKQEEAGAHILDVNVGLPGLDEPAVLTKMVEAIQEVTGLPLQLDTSNPVAMEAACVGTTASPSSTPSTARRRA